MNKFMKKAHKGFTIIQLVIGMLIFAILTGIAFYGVSVYTAQANETRVDSDLGTFEVAIKDYMLNNVNACSDGGLTLDGLNQYLTEENKALAAEAAALDAGVAPAAAESGKANAKLLAKSTLMDPWGHNYRIYIMNNTDGAEKIGTDSAKIYVYTMGKDNKGAGTTGNKADDSVLVVQYSDGEVFSRVYQPSDVKNASVKSNEAAGIYGKDGTAEGKMDAGIYAIDVTPAP